VSIFAKIEMKGKFRGQEGQTGWAQTNGNGRRAKYLHKAAASFIFRDAKQQALQVFLLQRIIYTCTVQMVVSIWGGRNDCIKGLLAAIEIAGKQDEYSGGQQDAQAVVQQSNTHLPQPSQPRVWTLECLASAS